jgi:hypothetical protein
MKFMKFIGAEKFWRALLNAATMLITGFSVRVVLASHKYIRG